MNVPYYITLKCSACKRENAQFRFLDPTTAIRIGCSQCQQHLTVYIGQSTSCIFAGINLHIKVERN